MKEIRPSTWAALIFLVLLIFGPALFIDFDDLTNVPEDKPFSNHTVAPPPGVTGPQRPQGPQKPADNESAGPVNTPEVNRGENRPLDNTPRD